MLVIEARVLGSKQGESVVSSREDLQSSLRFLCCGYNSSAALPSMMLPCPLSTAAKDHHV